MTFYEQKLQIIYKILGLCFKEKNYAICYVVRYIFDDHYYFQYPLLRNNPFIPIIWTQQQVF